MLSRLELALDWLIGVAFPVVIIVGVVAWAVLR